MMTHTRTPIAQGSVVTLDQVKARGRICHPDDDVEVQHLIDAAAIEIERHAEVALLRQRITLTVTAGCGSIRLPIGPVAPNAAVTVDGVAVVDGVKGHLHPVLDLPADMRGEVVVTYEAGFGDDDISIPADLALAVADHAVMMFDRRGDEEGPQGLSLAAARIAARYRRVGI